MGVYYSEGVVDITKGPHPTTEIHGGPWNSGSDDAKNDSCPSVDEACSWGDGNEPW